jgi:hypothetical protein
MPTFLDQILDIATHPAVMPHLAGYLSQRAAPKPDEHIVRLEQKMNEIYGELLSRRRKRHKRHDTTLQSTATNGPITSLADVRDHAVKLAATLKEAARFAREDPHHPEATRRIEDARRLADELTEAERYVLAPERVPESQRDAVRAVLPLIRRTRELALNSLDTAEGIEDAAAAAGRAATALQVAVATGSIPAGIPASDPLYARAAKVESGCVECGRAHLAAVAATLRRAAQEAKAKGWDSQDVQSRIAFALEELSALRQYDWTEDKIAKNPPQEQEALRRYAAQVGDLAEALRRAGPGDLDQLAALATQMRESYERDMSPSFRMIATGAARRDARIDRSRLELFGLPSETEVVEVTSPQDPSAYFDNIRRRIQERGVRVVFRQPDTSQPGIIVEGEYNPDTNAILLNPAAMDTKDPYHLQVLIHETVHALLHNKQCLPVREITPAIRERAEDATELAVIAAMTELGMPLEDRNGNVIVPSERRVDWEKLRAAVDPELYDEVRWATNWIVRAAQGADGTLAAEMCPALRLGVRAEGGGFPGPVSTAQGNVFTTLQRRVIVCPPVGGGGRG